MWYHKGKGASRPCLRKCEIGDLEGGESLKRYDVIFEHSIGGGEELLKRYDIIFEHSIGENSMQWVWQIKEKHDIFFIIAIRSYD